ALPWLVTPLVKARLRQETRRVILPGEEQALRAYLRERRQAGVRLNLNYLGEAVLGEAEAQRRLETYLNLLARDDVDYISVKLSSIYSQISLTAYEQSLEAVKQRLRALYRAAQTHHTLAADGTRLPKFVNLDMEEYRDLRLTLAAFRQVLDEEEFLGHRAGIVLQAYLPDSYPAQQELTEWAMARVARGGAPIKLRIVKGANLAMERIDAAWHGWPQAPYLTKAEVDANYKRMVVYGMQPERARAVHLGIASHNLFDIAYALLLRREQQVEPFVEFEMLEGMANHQARAVQEIAGSLLLYAPVVKQEDFHSAIAYLVRRFDENTGEGNFLRDLFGMEVGDAHWERQRCEFMTAVREQDRPATLPRRRQDRSTEQPVMDPGAPFANEPDTDWSLPQNQRWIAQVMARWRDHQPEPVPLQIGGQLIDTPLTGEGIDPAQPSVVRYRYVQATRAQVELALQTATAAQPRWGALSIGERKRLLVRCAEELARQRGDLIGVMALDGGKSVSEADTEVSEAVDYANYYARGLDLLESELADCDFTPLGVVLVTPPWNFPLAIPCGGTLAALMAGNAVILKPAPEAVLVGWRLCNVLWTAGIPQDVLQFVPTTDDEVGQALVTDERVGGVILTGSYLTAQLFQSWKPAINLMAETSGKNSLIITALADHDQAIRDLVHSAFSHAGQKCSAASLAILEAEVYDNPAFMRQLRDAVQSLPVGPAWDLASKVTPVIRPPDPDALYRALTTLDPGESWLVEPRPDQANPNLWSPGVKLGVQPGSFFHRTECFGPVLGVMRAETLDDAIRLANDSEFGLTGGLHSLDPREIARWQEQIEVGNAYINRTVTGAIVRRQPFGGWKCSVFGPGAKAGGPNYLLNLGRWQQRGLPARRAQPSPAIETLLTRLIEAGRRHGMLRPDEVERLQAAAESYADAWLRHFSQEHDPSQILGERNLFRYRPLRRMLLRLEAGAAWVEIGQIVLAAATCGVPLHISLAPAVEARALDGLLGLGKGVEVAIEVVVEDEAQLAERLGRREAERLRVLAPLSEAVQRAANEAHLAVIGAPALANGRLELRHYLREQVISQTTHRYGNLLTPEAPPAPAPA
ncbi:MAG TPA: bifunctional proline dehydrogenase/L-glutamate gamma-semialdehyde dehydrogenase, partial [Caldilineaceae bacterium]|nr:bifunctional proline dehydrogenase/L-glutamate gamma-semialdehyde dehydrogenase [Caldilineaceae bacterium]